METPTSRVRWSQLCHGLRPTVKDSVYYSHSAFIGEGEVFEKLAHASYTAVVSGQEVKVRMVVRSLESAVIDGFLLVLNSEFAGTLPEEDATYLEIWAWAAERPGVRFIGFDVKTIALTSGGASREHKYYQWSEVRTFEEKQAELAEFIVGIIEGVDSHLVILPQQTWADALEDAVGAETLLHGMPLWVVLGLVADDALEHSLTSIVEASVAQRPFSRSDPPANVGPSVLNATNGVQFHGWLPVSTEAPAYDPNATYNMLRDRGVIQAMWKEVIQAGGRVYHNPYTPLAFDFIIQIPDLGWMWIEHKVGAKVRAWQYAGAKERHNPFQARRVWHFCYIECNDGIICIPRGEVDYTWAAEGLPMDAKERWRSANFADALEKIIRPNLTAARDAVTQAAAELQPSDMNEGVSNKESRARLELASKRLPSDDPLLGLIQRLRTAPGAAANLNRWHRTRGDGVCLALGGGNRNGSHAVVEHQWSEDDKAAFDEYGELPVSYLTAGLHSRKFVPLLLQDHSMPSNRGAGLSYPFAIKREHYKIPMKRPRPLILGYIGNNSWFLLLPSGLMANYQNGPFLQARALADRERGGHVFSRLSSKSVLHPDWTSSAYNAVFDGAFLVDDEVNLGRYVLNLTDGTIHQEIMRVLRADGPISIANPLLRRSPNREFNALEYQSTMGQMMQDIWDYSYERGVNGSREGRAGEAAADIV